MVDTQRTKREQTRGPQRTLSPYSALSCTQTAADPDNAGEPRSAAGAGGPTLGTQCRQIGESATMTQDLPLTGERTVPGIAEENYWFRRHEAAYEFVAPLVA